jgi:heme/copper-type cytochrome/quinol oxidase subunit 4
MIIDIAFGSQITKDASSHLSISTAAFYFTIIIINLVLFLLGLLLFRFLLEKRNWARIVLLFVGWLAVIDVVSSLLLSSKVIEILQYFNLDLDMSRLILIDRITDFIGVIFWGYAIYILQFNSDIKRIYFSENTTNMIDQKLV